MSAFTRSLSKSRNAFYMHRNHYRSLVGRTHTGAKTVHPCRAPVSSHLFRRSFSSDSTPVANVGLLLDESSERMENKDALRYVHQKLRFTYKEFRQSVDAYANGLHDIGFKKGDHIALWLPNSMEHTTLFMAAARLGVVVNVIDPTISDIHFLEHVLDTTRAKAFVFDPKYMREDRLALVQTDLVPELAQHDLMGPRQDQLLQSKRFPSLRFIIQTGFDQFPGIINMHWLITPDPAIECLPRFNAEVQPADSLCVFHSCNPRTRKPTDTGAFTHKDMIAAASSQSKDIQLTSDDSLLIGNDQWESPGAFISVLSSIIANSQAVVTGDKISINDEFKTALRNEQCTAFSGSQNFLDDIEKIGDEKVSGSLKKKFINESVLSSLSGKAL